MGTEAVKNLGKADSFNGNVGFLWRELPEEEKAAFDGRTEAEQRTLLAKLMGLEDKRGKGKPKKTSEVVKRVQRPRRDLARLKESKTM